MMLRLVVADNASADIGVITGAADNVIQTAVDNTVDKVASLA